MMQRVWWHNEYDHAVWKVWEMKHLLSNIIKIYNTKTNIVSEMNTGSVLAELFCLHFVQGPLQTTCYYGRFIMIGFAL